MSDHDKEKPTLHLVPQNGNAGQAGARTFGDEVVPTKFDEWPLDALKCYAASCEGIVRGLIVFGRAMERNNRTSLELMEALARLAKAGLGSTMPGSQRVCLQQLSQLLQETLSAKDQFRMPPMDWENVERALQ